MLMHHGCVLGGGALSHLIRYRGYGPVRVNVMG